MKLEYLLFNIIILSGPLALSFEKRVHYLGKWKYAFRSILLVLIPFIVWDILVTGRHWWFNNNYISGIKVAGLPVEEWLFFITVPFAVLFIWENLIRKTGNPVNPSLKNVWIYLLFLSLPGALMLWIGKEYTGLMLISLSLVGLLDGLFNTRILSRNNTYIYLGMVFLLNIIFNGYLTARPVVIYDPSYQLDLRLITIPVEDIGYGFALILMNTVLYQKFRRVTNER